MISQRKAIDHTPLLTSVLWKEVAVGQELGEEEGHQQVGVGGYEDRCGKMCIILLQTFSVFSYVLTYVALPHLGEPLPGHGGDRAVSDGPLPAALHDALQLATCGSSSQLPAEDAGLWCR